MKGVFALLWLLGLVLVATAHGNPIGDGMQTVLAHLTQVTR